MGFLPEGYERPASNGGFMKFEDGDNLIRILSHAVVGYEYWTTSKKCIRSKEFPKSTPDIKTGKDGKPERPKHFWIFVVWNYKTKAVEVLEITQSGVQKTIENYVMDTDWGDPTSYDLKINKTGSGLETEYAVTAKPKKPIPQEAADTYAGMTINLENMFTTGNPFSDEAPADIDTTFNTTDEEIID